MRHASYGPGMSAILLAILVVVASGGCSADQFAKDMIEEMMAEKAKELAEQGLTIQPVKSNANVGVGEVAEAIAPVELQYVVEGIDAPFDLVNALYAESGWYEVNEVLIQAEQAEANEWDCERLCRTHYNLTQVETWVPTLNETVPVDVQQQVLDAWCEGDPENYLPYLLRGMFRTNLAWRVRGGGFASSVDVEHQLGFEALLKDALNDLLQAYKLNPKSPHPPARLITVAMGGGLPRDMMETYFQAAIEARPYHLMAHKNKFLYLAPKWHGTIEDYRAFGKECSAKAKDYPLLALVSVDGLLELSRMQNRQNRNLPAYSLLKDEPIWAEVERALSRIEDQYPDRLRTQFDWAYLASKSKRYEIALSHFHRIDDRWLPDTLWDSEQEYREARSLACVSVAHRLIADSAFDQAEALAFEALRFNAEKAAAYLQLSYIAGSGRQDFAAAKRFSELALAEQPNDEQAKAARQYIELANHRLGATQ